MLEPQVLREQFELVIGIYRKSRKGRTLTEWLKEDWRLFSALDAASGIDLLADILDDREIVRETFVAPSSNSSIAEQWPLFKEELMYSNRFFTQALIDLDRLNELLPQLLVDTSELDNEWFRCRVQRGNQSFCADEMGAPPKEHTSHGRANPPGIPYLYLASELNTAIAECRPHTGDIACVARFEMLSENLSLLDLQNPRVTVSPFILGDDIEVDLLRRDTVFLELLGEELTKPILPYAAATNYLSTQYLCEFAKHCGFGGVLYQSAVGDGVNAALFDTASAEISSDVHQYYVSRVVVSAELR